ncbi:MAG: cupin domain-containing protein, partial [Alphaproteobacteria bacterium]
PAQPELSRLIAEGWLWNSGIFVMRAGTLLEEMERADPDMVRNCRAALDAARKREGGLYLQRSAYSRCRSISLDHAVMERTRKAVVVPFKAGWKDVGSWPALWEISSQDAQGNAVIGDAILEESRNCLIHSRDALVGALGVEDLVIAATADAILVSRRDQGHRVGELLSKLPRERRGNQPPRVRICRPWGWFETLGLGPGFQVKRLHVKVGGRLSLQRHEHRSEHWVVLSGAARVTRGSHTRKLGEKESILIAAGEWHRLENAGSEPLELIEIQTGSYLGEDDIRRCDDLPSGPQAGGVQEPEG